MKLNLLPAKSSRSGSVWGGVAAGVVIALIGLVSAGFLVLVSEGAKNNAHDEAVASQKMAADAVATANVAEDQVAQAAVVVTNQQLASAMISHANVHPDLFNKVRAFVPSYYRLTSISAQPAGEQAVVTMTGQLQTFSQYADLAIALWKIPNIVSVSRAGYVIDSPRVPNLSEIDQRGLPIRPGESPLPTDSLEFMEAMIARANDAPVGYQNVGGFGSGDDLSARGAMPGWSTVTMTVILNENIRVPDPRATIAANRGPATPAVPTGGFSQVGGGRGPGGPVAPGGPMSPDMDER